MNGAEFLEYFVQKVARCEPPAGQERVEEPPTIEDWARFKRIQSYLGESNV